MQMAFDLGARTEIERIRDRLAVTAPSYDWVPVREPVAQLVKSMISSKTLDAVSFSAFDRLVDAYPDWKALMQADAADVTAVIADVNFPERKSPEVIEALRRIWAERGSFDLNFLSGLTVTAALAWLERLKGVKRKIAASTLNFSTLNRPAFVVDTHVKRVMRHIGMVSPNADTFRVYDQVMEATPDWGARDYVDLHVLVKRHGQTFCQDGRTACRCCPLRMDCRTGRGR